MKTVGSRRQPEITARADGRSLAAAARFNESIARLAQSTFIPKGVYRFKSHEAANKHQQDCLARGMGLLAVRRSHAGSTQPPSDT